jgi:hypothetical protein
LRHTISIRDGITVHESLAIALALLAAGEGVDEVVQFAGVALAETETFEWVVEGALHFLGGGGLDIMG